MNPILSIIIPCYNSQSTLEFTLESVINQDFQDWEAIIVDDGSTDGTRIIAQEFGERDKRFRYFFKNNEGLAKTRNFAIKMAVGCYILPLDSDNLVSCDFANNAINVFKNNPEIGVVHGNALFFGEKKGLWKIPEFDLERIMIHNYIDACAIIRKSLFKYIQNYDEKMPHQGHEDWDLWLAFGVEGMKFFHLNEITFQYRVTNSSMINSFTSQMVDDNISYLVKKYHLLYFTVFKRLKEKEVSSEEKKMKSVFNFLKKWYNIRT